MSAETAGDTGSRLPIVSPDDQKVTFVELFFDLILVFCVTRVTALLHDHLDFRSVATGGALWFAVPYMAVRAIGLPVYPMVAVGLAEPTADAVSEPAG